MTLSEILSGTGLVQPLAPDLAHTSISGLEHDSRRVAAGSVSFAFPGAKADGRQFAADALARGAAAVVSESETPAELAARWVRVQHGREALAVAARNFYGRPDERLQLTGLTGTNGKTTTSFRSELAARWGRVHHGREALAVPARNFSGRPDERLQLNGITGTNGKTTTSY